MNAGQIISGVGHVGLIGWVLFGGAFQSDPLPFEVTEVSVISASDFEALLASDQAPEPVTDVALPVEPETPVAPADTPQTDAPPEAVQPQASEPPVAETLPQTPAPLPPQPETTEVVPLPQLEPSPNVDLQTALVRPKARPADRIAPQPVAQPNPETTPDIDVAPEVSAEVSEAPVEEAPQEATAPEEAAPEIVTEADEQTNAPLASVRPPARRPAALAQQAPSEEAPSDAIADAVSDAVSDALADALEEAAPAATPSVPSGPPLTAGETDALRVAVAQCWNVGSLSSEALNTTVVVAMSMNRDATPVVGSIRLETFTGGSDAAARQAFEAARRAIIRCGARGYGLPDEKYEQWKEIEITFNPERMRNR